jgi:cobalt-zinc-cadmium efflux system protein
MPHDHSHHNHSHTVNESDINRAFIVGIALNFLFVIIEVIVGLSIHSLSLLSDAGHNLADVGSLALSLFAIRMSKVKPNTKYTYGYKKTTILVALMNAVVLLVSIGAIGYEALHRFLNPEPISGTTIAIVAAIGIVINTGTALMFLKNKESDLNVKSAYLHLMSDALVSVGLVIGGIAIFYTGWVWIDPVLSLLIAATILLSTWSLLSHSLRLSMDGVPHGIDFNHIKQIIKQQKGIKEIHHVHIWAISTTQNALTAHLILEDKLSFEQIAALKKHIRHELEHENIQHATFETETVNCNEIDC